TRRHVWVDRLASAWLVRRFVDAEARFIWLENPANCPPDAVGFDFDSAEFTHVGKHVTFEVLLAAFGLDKDPLLGRIAAVVHFLDAGGAAVAEAPGVEMVLSGLRRQCGDDDALLAQAMGVFDSMYAAGE
ncbi:MAG: chromate resistance protein ChrB domain-containing protein, partial [Sulfuricella sp.]